MGLSSFNKISVPEAPGGVGFCKSNSVQRVPDSVAVLRLPVGLGS